MEASNLQHEIIQEMTLLLDKTAVAAFAPVITETETDAQDVEAILINLKAINAKYDKSEAIAQVKALMERYNIQIDELLERIKF